MRIATRAMNDMLQIRFLEIIGGLIEYLIFRGQMMFSKFNRLVLFLILCAMSIFSDTQTASAANEAAQLTPMEKKQVAAVEAATKVWTRGPAKIPFIDQAILDLPKNYFFIPKKEASDLMLALGNSTDSNFLGIILDPEDGMRWYITVDYIKSGHVKDDDASKLDGDSLLKSIKQDTEEENKQRIAQGISTLNVVGWIQIPSYNKKQHHLEWSILAQDSGATEDSRIVNYNSVSLGREGMLKMVLVAPNSTIAQDKTHVQVLQELIQYNAGKEYLAFVESTDKVAEFGLAALITGVIAKKVGLFAVLGVLLLKAGKFAIFGVVIFWSKIKKLFKSSKTKNDASVEESSDENKIE